VIFSDDYPIIPPIIRFHTPIYHLNISADGHICHDLFDIGWSTAINMVEILHTLNKLLIEPDIHNAISEENLQFYEQDRKAYEQRVYKHCAQHASKTSDQLKCIYRLEET
jgi:ubiquitin-protein ligase